MHNNQEKLLIQENEYSIPYHWMRGRNLGKLYDLRTDIALRLSGNLEDKTVLDYGCGDGKFTNTLVNAGASEVFGIDISQNALGFARKLVPSANFMVFQGEQIEFSDKYFDVIFSLDVIEHISDNDRDRILTELIRILKPGGKLVLTVPSINKNLDAKHFRHFIPGELIDKLKDKFSNFEIQGYFSKPHFLPVMLFDTLYNRRFIWKLFSALIRLCDAGDALYFALSCDKNKDNSIL